MLRLPGGTDATVELRSLAASLDVLRAGRPAVYLDQNQRSRLGDWRHELRPVPAAEAQAAERLVQLVESRQVVLPVSAGHLVETGPLYGERRVAVASTVLELGRGWQMRNPDDVLDVRTADPFLSWRRLEIDIPGEECSVIFPSEEKHDEAYEILRSRIPALSA